MQHCSIRYCVGPSNGVPNVQEAHTVAAEVVRMSSFRLDGRHHTGIRYSLPTLTFAVLLGCAQAAAVIIPSVFRASSCWLGILERATGSAQLELEGTKVITAVHGPLVVGGRREHPARATIEVVFKPCSGIAGVPFTCAHAFHFLVGVAGSFIYVGTNVSSSVHCCHETKHDTSCRVRCTATSSY